MTEQCKLGCRSVEDCRDAGSPCLNNPKSLNITITTSEYEAIKAVLKQKDELIAELSKDAERLREFINSVIELGELILKRKRAVKHDLYEYISMMVGVSRIALDRPDIFAYGTKLDKAIKENT